jgi:hypothetical protein
MVEQKLEINVQGVKYPTVDEGLGERARYQEGDTTVLT